MKHQIKAVSACISVLLAVLATPARAQTAASSNIWQGSVNLGLTLTRGNSDTTLLSAGITAQGKWPHDLLALRIDGLYGEAKIAGESKPSETADLLHGAIQYNRDFTSRFYGYMRVDGLHDGIADIQYRVSATPGLGYYIIKEKKVDLSAEVGAGYVDEKLDSQYESYATLRAAEKFHWAITARSRFWETIEYLPQVDAFGNYIVNFETGVEAGLNKKNNLALRTVLQDTYNNEPAPDRLKNDLKLIAGLSYKF